MYTRDLTQAADLISIHVGLSATASLPNHQGEMIIQLAMCHLLCCFHYGFANLFIQAILHIHLGSCQQQQFTIDYTLKKKWNT